MDEIDKTLDEISERLKQWENERKAERKTLEKRKLVKYGLRGPEAVGWLNEESYFKKPIVKRSSDDSYHDNSSDDNLTELFLGSLLRGYNSR